MLHRQKQFWTRFWMRYSGLGRFGRLATRLATLFAPPHKARVALARMNPSGFVAPSVVRHHPDIRFGRHVFIDDRVVIYRAKDGGPVNLGDGATILRDSIIETGNGGEVSLGHGAYIHPRCQLNAYNAKIDIGRGVMLAANCVCYPHDHGTAPGRPIIEQPLETKGPIIIGDHAWLGTGVVVLGGVRIGDGAVIGAGSVVTRDIPDNAIAFGVPARVVRVRGALRDCG